jgi:hypothetical protein
MMTKIILQKKVAALCCLLACFIVNNRLCAQIVYTNIADATPNATYPLDLNNDGVIDFLIQFDAGAKIMCKPQSNNAYLGELVGGVHLAWALSPSRRVCDTSATWYGAANNGTMAWGANVGYWVGQTDKYLALKLMVGTNTYYGWARFDVLPTSASFTIKDYAYQSTPNACIQLGQTTLGIQENRNIFSIAPNPFISSTTIQMAKNLDNATLTMCNSLGQMVKQVKNISGQTISLYRDNLPTGTYFVRLTAENSIVSVVKVIITD